MRVNYILKVLITPLVLVKKYFAWTYHKVNFVYDNLFSELARLFGTGRCGFVRDCFTCGWVALTTQQTEHF